MKRYYDEDDLFINSYQNNYDNDDYSDDDLNRKEKDLTIVEITDNQLKLFIKENSKDIKHIKQLYNKDLINDDIVLLQFKDCLFNLKDKFNNVMIDTYNEHIKISNLYKEQSYVRFGAKKLNEYLQQKVFKG